MAGKWVWMQTGIPPKCKLSKWRKESLKARADEFVDAFNKPASIKPPPQNPRFNYVVDFSTKWRGPHLQFIARYACPGPNALAGSRRQHPRRSRTSLLRLTRVQQ